jgi:hypothetical protein
MFDALSKYLDLLKASGWQTGAIAAAAGLFLYLSQAGVLPPLDPPWVVLIVWAIIFVCGALAAASLGSTLQAGARSLLARFKRYQAYRTAEQAFRDYVPHLTEEERIILGYLREKNQKTFVADHDGGYANMLLARGFVVYIGTRGQSFDIDKVPMAVPDHVWKVIQEMPEQFPYKPEFSDRTRGRKVEVEPWRIPWGAR